jgi:hypothetical protein
MARILPPDRVQCVGMEHRKRVAGHQVEIFRRRLLGSRGGPATRNRQSLVIVARVRT